MAKLEECIKIGDKFYLNTDVHKVLEARIKEVTIDEVVVEDEDVVIEE